MVRKLIFSFDFGVNFGGKMGVANMRPAYGLGPPKSKPDQKVDPLDRTFGSTATSKSCLRNFQG